MIASVVIYAIPGDHGDNGDGLWWLVAALFWYVVPLGVAGLIASLLSALVSRLAAR